MCGYAVHWIWPSTKKPSSIKCMQAARKLPLRRCRRCNGRMTKRCKTRRAILKKIGIQSEIVAYEKGEYIKRAVSGKYDVLLIGWRSNIPDPDKSLQILYSDAGRNGFNFSKWRNKTFDDLIQKSV